MPIAMTEKVLIVLHQEQSTPGRVGYALRDRGYALDIRRPRFGDPLPTTMAEHAGAVIFGGPQSANDPDDFIKAEIDFIGVPLRENKPYLGICLGAQMLAKHLGERVAPHPEGKAEVGYYPIKPTAAGRAICNWPAYMYQWHREGFDLPRGVELLAEGDIFPIQAFRAGSGFRDPVSRRSHPRDDVPLDHARTRAHGIARRQAAPRAFRRPPGLRSRHPRVALGFPRPLARRRQATAAARGGGVEFRVRAA